MGDIAFFFMRRPAYGSLLPVQHAGRAAGRGKSFPCSVAGYTEVAFQKRNGYTVIKRKIRDQSLLSAERKC